MLKVIFRCNMVSAEGKKLSTVGAILSLSRTALTTAVAALSFPAASTAVIL
ncbi:MAG: hypothetical protein WC900_00920 [Oscillospiraceae bacterium]